MNTRDGGAQHASTPLRLRPELVWQEVDDQVVVLDPATSTYHAITGAGTHLWPSLVAGTSREELQARMQQSFGIEADVARTDLEVFLAELAPFLRPGA